MDNDIFKEHVEEWLKKLKAGDAHGAKQYYYQNLFDNVLTLFSEREGKTLQSQWTHCSPYSAIRLNRL